MMLNSLPNDKILDQSNFKAFAEDTLNVVQIIICVSDRVENLVGKGENAGYQHFLLFPQGLQKASLSGSLKVEILWSRVKTLPDDDRDRPTTMSRHFLPKQRGKYAIQSFPFYQLIFTF